MKIIVEKGVLLGVEVDYEKDIDVKEFAIPNGVIKLEKESLAYLPMEVETLYIPSSVEEISEGALFGEAGNWENLNNIIVEEGNPNYKSQDGCLIDIKNNTVILGTANAIIPNGIEKVGFYAFRQRENLTEITIPASVKEVDMQAFACCRNLKKVTVLGKDTNIDRLCFIGDVAIEEFYIPEESDYKFVDGSLIKKTGNVLLLVTENGIIPPYIKGIENGAIFRSDKDIEIPESVEEFGDISIIVFGGKKVKVKKDSAAHKYAVENKLLYEEI